MICIQLSNNLRIEHTIIESVDSISRDGPDMPYRKLRLIGAYAYSGERNDSMRLIRDMRLYGT